MHVLARRIKYVLVGSSKVLLVISLAAFGGRCDLTAGNDLRSSFVSFFCQRKLDSLKLASLVP